MNKADREAYLALKARITEEREEGNDNLANDLEAQLKQY